MDNPDRKILKSRSAICHFMDIGKAVFYELVEAGLPVRQLSGGRWVGHEFVIDQWFRDFTSSGDCRPDP